MPTPNVGIDAPTDYLCIGLHVAGVKAYGRLADRSARWTRSGATGHRSKRLLRDSCMGHSTITMTLDRYGHLMPGNEDEAAEMLAAYLQREAQ
jgi:hypothetical protein